jgi:hypothetical protein
MLELKSTISQVLRIFKVIDRDPKEDFHIAVDLILKNDFGLKVRLQKR